MVCRTNVSFISISFQYFPELFFSEAHWPLAKEVIGFFPRSLERALVAQIRYESIMDQFAKGSSFFGSTLLGLPEYFFFDQDDDPFLYSPSPHPLPQGEREPARGKEFRLRHSQVKKISDYLYERIGIGTQFVVSYTVDRGESLAGGRFDPSHVS